MSILVNENTRLVVQGMTGREGSFHTERCIQFGTKVVGGVTPGRGGTEHLGLPVFDSVREAVEKVQANASLVFVPAAFATDAVLEAAEGGVKLVVCITDGVPTLDMVVIADFLRKRGVRMIGPNCPGVTSPGAKAKVGIIPGNIHLPGRVGVVSRSGTLTYEAVAQLTKLGIGQSTCVGIGGDPIVGSRFRDILELFEADPETDAAVLIGEIGGTAEQEAAEFIKTMTKPVTAFIAGATAPPGRRMGHAGAIITGEAATAAAKKKALAEAGAFIAESPAAIGITAQRLLQAKGVAARR